MKKRKRIHINPTTFETYQTRCKPRPRLAKPCDRSTCGLPTPSLTGSHLILLKESTSGLDSERSERVSENKIDTSLSMDILWTAGNLEDGNEWVTWQYIFSIEQAGDERWEKNQLSTEKSFTDYMLSPHRSKAIFGTRVERDTCDYWREYESIQGTN